MIHGRWVLLALLLSPLSMADILWMHNGDRLTGTIEDITDKQVRIALPYSAITTIHRSAIKRWRLDKQVKPKSTVKNGIKLGGVSAEDNHAWLWTGNSVLNIKLKDNEKQTNNVSLKASTELSNLHWRYSLDGEYIYDTANDITNSHKYRLKPMLDHFFDDRWFARSSVDVDYNLLSADYLDLGYAAGFGYRFWNNKTHRLELVGQLGLQRSYFTPDYWSDTNLFSGRIVNYPMIIVGWDYRQPLLFWQEKIELFSEGTYKKFVNQPSGYFTWNKSINGSVGVRYYINKSIHLSWSSELSWDEAWLHYHDIHESMDDKEWRHFITLGASF